MTWAVSWADLLKAVGVRSWVDLDVSGCTWAKVSVVPLMSARNTTNMINVFNSDPLVFAGRCLVTERSGRGDILALRSIKEGVVTSRFTGNVVMFQSSQVNSGLGVFFAAPEGAIGGAGPPGPKR